MKIKERITSVEIENAHGRASCDDYLDAYIAWYLGNKFLHKTPEHPIVLLGNTNTGAWLLPNDDSVTLAFDQFIKENECE